MRKSIMGMKAAAVAMAVTLGVTALGFGGATAGATSVASQAKSAYQKYTGQNKSITVDYLNGYDFEKAQTGKFVTSKKKISLKSFIRCKIQDVNGDNVPELILSNKNSYKSLSGKVLICTYKDGKVKPVFCVGGLRSGIYKAKGSSLCFGFGGSTEKTYVFTNLTKAATLKHVATYRHQTVREKGNKVTNNYYRNATKIKKAAFNKAAKKVGKEIQL